MERKRRPMAKRAELEDAAALSSCRVLFHPINEAFVCWSVIPPPETASMARFTRQVRGAWTWRSAKSRLVVVGEPSGLIKKSSQTIRHEMPV